MLIKYIVNHKKKIIKIKKDKLNGSRFNVDLAREVFDIEDKGYTVECSNKYIKRKFNSFKVACWRHNK